VSAAPVVCDAGPILHLHEAGALELLALTGPVNIPPEVDRELRRLMSDGFVEKPAWIRVVGLEDTLAAQATLWRSCGLLHAGESEALELALQLKADWFLTDDNSARVFATSLRIEAHGSLGVVLWAAAHAHLTPAESLARLEALFGSSLWVSPSVRTEAREALKRIHASS